MNLQETSLNKHKYLPKVLLQTLLEFKRFKRSYYAMVLLTVWVGFSLIGLFQIMFTTTSGNLGSGSPTGTTYSLFNSILPFTFVYMVYASGVFSEEKESGMEGVLRASGRWKWSLVLGKLFFVIILNFILSAIWIAVELIGLFSNGSFGAGVHYEIDSAYTIFFMFLSFILVTLIPATQSILFSAVSKRKSYSLMLSLMFFFVTFYLASNLMTYYGQVTPVHQLISSNGIVSAPISSVIIMLLNPVAYSGIFSYILGMSAVTNVSAGAATSTTINFSLITVPWMYLLAAVIEVSAILVLICLTQRSKIS